MAPAPALALHLARSSPPSTFALPAEEWISHLKSWATLQDKVAIFERQEPAL